MDDSLFLDRSNDVNETKGLYLPHWHQNNKIQFITFRLADSFPQSFIFEFKQRLSNFIKRNPQPWDINIKSQYYSLKQSLEQYLDQGFGSCILRSESIRKEVEATIHHNADKKYELISYVIMPNHVHLLMRPYEDTELRHELKQIKGISAYRINRLTNQKGPIWQKDYYDTIIRNKLHFYRVLEYIANNPKYLRPGEYSYFLSPHWIF